MNEKRILKFGNMREEEGDVIGIEYISKKFVFLPGRE